MKRCQRFLVIVLLSLSLTLGFQLNLTAQVSPDQLVQQAQRQYQLGKSGSAIALLEQARQIYQSQSQLLPQAQILALMSLAQQQTGDWDIAQQNLDASLGILDNVASSSSKTQVLAQIKNIEGHYLFARGQHNQALSNWQQAEQLYRQIDDPLGISGTILDQAEALSKMGFYRRSCDRILVAFEQPESSCENLREEQISSIIEQTRAQVKPWQVTGLISMGNSLLLMGKFSLAQTLIEKSQVAESNLFNSLPTNKAKILLNLGNLNSAIALRSKKYDNLSDFISHRQQAIKYYQQLDQHTAIPAINSYQLLAQLNQLSLLLVSQQWEKAQTLVSKIQLPQENKRNLYTEVQFANSLNLLKQHNIKIKYSWLDLVDIYRGTIKQAQLIGDHRIESYAWGYLGRLAQEQNLQLDQTPQQLLEQALILAQGEHAPEMAYRWQWHLGQIYCQQGQRSKAISSYQAALANLSDLRGDLAVLDREVEMARNVIEALQVAELDNYFQDACLTFEPRSIEQIDQDAAIIYTIVLPERLEIILATSDAQPSPHQMFAHHTEVIKQAKLEKTVQQLRQYITEPDRVLEVQQLSKQIYGWLIAPLEANFTQFDSQVLLNEQFTPSNLLQQLNQTSATIVHLATHGQFRSDPRQTFLLMWQKLLTIQEFSTLLQSRIRAITNPIDLLILSACETATGDRRAALGLAGIAVRNGSLSTLATLWQVNDESTAELMKLFYQQLESKNKAEALRQAQLELWSRTDKDWQVPAFWSAYIIIGNWQ